MSRKLRTRPRLAAAAAVTLAGGLLAVGSPPAQAECSKAYVWYYTADDPSKRHYLVDEDCLWSPFEGDQTHRDDTHTETGTLPPWAPEGVGYEIILMFP